MYEPMNDKPVSGNTWMQAIEPLLREGHTFSFTPEGTSMYPFIMSQRDFVTVAWKEPDKLRRGDIILYERPDHSLIVHRIYRKKHDYFYMVGDNESIVECLFSKDQIKACAICIHRNGKDISCDDLRYKLLSEIWMWLKPLRHTIVKIRKKIYRKYGV